VLDLVTRRDRYSPKKPLRSSARGASFHTKHASNANVVRVVLLDANSYFSGHSGILNVLFGAPRTATDRGGVFCLTG
jgi:hypothetical protein